MSLHDKMVEVAAEHLQAIEMPFAARVKGIQVLAGDMAAAVGLDHANILRLISGLEMIIERSWLKSSASEGSADAFEELKAYRALLAHMKDLL